MLHNGPERRVFLGNTSSLRVEDSTKKLFVDAIKTQQEKVLIFTTVNKATSPISPKNMHRDTSRLLDLCGFMTTYKKDSLCLASRFLSLDTKTVFQAPQVKKLNHQNITLSFLFHLHATCLSMAESYLKWVKDNLPAKTNIIDKNWSIWLPNENNERWRYKSKENIYRQN